MSDMMVYSLALAVFVAFLMGAVGASPRLVAVLFCLIPPAGLLFMVFSSDGDSNSKAAVLVFGGMLTVILSPLVGVAGFVATLVGGKLGGKATAARNVGRDKIDRVE